MRTLQDFGEFGLLGHLGVDKTKLPPGWLGPGDDCALIPIGEETLAVTSDLLIEGVHFRLGTTSAVDLGYKALAASLSDLASMGATPLAATISIALPASTGIVWVENFYSGLKACEAEYGCPLVGGDTSSGEKVFINITALGRCQGGAAVLRSGAAVGEDLWVSGWPGESRGGLLLLESEIDTDSIALQTLIKRHTRPTPRVGLGAALLKTRLATSMIDLSDGLTKDAAHIAEESGVGIDISLSLLPVSTSLSEYSNFYGGVDLPMLVLTGGEDYELLFTAKPESREEIMGISDTLELPLHRIGATTPPEGVAKVRVTDGDSGIFELASAGFEHFK
ncbi:MAG: thiamine-phosphate kinase [Deltaproteobacteria bacterium]|nr:MAG: thiamine-phosphate kinase [Deltaproteobacteria bacterium]